MEASYLTEKGYRVGKSLSSEVLTYYEGDSGHYPTLPNLQHMRNSPVGYGVHISGNNVCNTVLVRCLLLGPFAGQLCG